MRLSEYEHQILTKHCNALFPHARLYLFGSRTDDNKRGGDIDLYLETEDKSDLVYHAKLLKTLNENFIHLRRIRNAFDELSKQYTFPISIENFRELIDNVQNIAYVDQVIYRFSKLQDGIGAKLFKAFLLAQGENVDKPFLDILHRGNWKKSL